MLTLFFAASLLALASCQVHIHHVVPDRANLATEKHQNYPSSPYPYRDIQSFHYRPRRYLKHEDHQLSEQLEHQSRNDMFLGQHAMKVHGGNDFNSDLYPNQHHQPLAVHAHGPHSGAGLGQSGIGSGHGYGHSGLNQISTGSGHGYGQSEFGTQQGHQQDQFVSGHGINGFEQGFQNTGYGSQHGYGHSGPGSGIGLGHSGPGSGTGLSHSGPGSGIGLGHSGPGSGVGLGHSGPGSGVGLGHSGPGYGNIGSGINSGMRTGEIQDGIDVVDCEEGPIGHQSSQSGFQQNIRPEENIQLGSGLHQQQVNSGYGGMKHYGGYKSHGY